MNFSQLHDRIMRLPPSGSSGFEGYLRDILTEVTGASFGVLKSGPQEGADVLSDPGDTLLTVALEGKQYQQSTRLSAGLLRLALAHALQSKVRGGVTKSADRKLCELAAGSNGPPPGTRLSRSWQGKLHIVTVTEERRFNWQGKDWASLSVIARTITGTRWSGPAFFGTRARKAA